MGAAMDADSCARFLAEVRSPPQKIHVCAGMAETIACSEMMTGLSRIAVALIVFGLVPLAGCTRTSDGTVVMPKPPALPTLSFSKLLPSLGPARPAEPEPIAAAQFPAAPKPPARTRPKATGRIVMEKTSLACLDQTGAGDRVRVVCK